jgi:hypothetical protein
VYDMYPWGEGSAARDADTSDTSGPTSTAVPASPVGPASTPGPESAVSAVQVALDRRDNGGDPAAAPAMPTASPARQ